MTFMVLVELIIIAFTLGIIFLIVKSAKAKRKTKAGVLCVVLIGVYVTVYYTLVSFITNM